MQPEYWQPDQKAKLLRKTWMCSEMHGPIRLILTTRISLILTESFNTVVRYLIRSVYFKVRILTDAVDDITTVDDFLAVTENHILEDVNECVAALQVNMLMF